MTRTLYISENPVSGWDLWDGRQEPRTLLGTYGTYLNACEALRTTP